MTWCYLYVRASIVNQRRKQSEESGQLGSKAIPRSCKCIPRFLTPRTQAHCSQLITTNCGQTWLVTQQMRTLSCLEHRARPWPRISNLISKFWKQKQNVSRDCYWLHPWFIDPENLREKSNPVNQASPDIGRWLTIFLLGHRKAWHSKVSFLLVAMKANTRSYVASAEQYEILKRVSMSKVVDFKPKRAFHYHF